MATTLGDFGRCSERFGNIAFYYAFPIKFWFGQHMIAPDDVHSWCLENCKGYYKIVSYTHDSSTRKKYSRSNEYDEKVMFVDKVYLSSEEDATLIKLAFDVREQQIRRPGKMKARRKARKAKV